MLYNGRSQKRLASLSGKSAYEFAVNNGYSDTEEEWVSALEAAPSKDSASIKTAAFSGNGKLPLTISDNTVLNLGKAVGTDGKDGVGGVNGTDQVGITSTSINTDGQLVLKF